MINLVGFISDQLKAQARVRGKTQTGYTFYLNGMSFIATPSLSIILASVPSY